MLAARRNRRYKGNHHLYRETSVFIKLLCSHCFQLLQSIKEEPRGHQGSLDWLSRCSVRNSLHRMAICLFSGSYCLFRAEKQKTESFCPVFAQCLPRVNGEISSEGIFNTPRKEFLTRQKNSHFAQQFSHFAQHWAKSSGQNSPGSRFYIYCHICITNEWRTSFVRVMFSRKIGTL